MNATKALAIFMAGATALALCVLIMLDEPHAEDLPIMRVDEARPISLPTAKGGRMLRGIDRQSFSSPWPLVEDQATITCGPDKVATVITSSGEYGLSGPAIAAGYRSIWDPVLPVQLRRDAALADLVEAALALCPAGGREALHEIGEGPR